MIRSHFSRVVLAITAAWAGGCQAIGITCTDVGRFAVNVQVRNARTGTPEADGALLIIRNDVYVDSMRGRAGGPPVLAAGPEQTGTFEVRVEKAGFRAWQRNNVRVGRSGACERLQSAILTALLEPTP